MVRTTKQHQNYWRNRKNIDWQTAYGAVTWDHPHRFVISALLKNLDWLSLIEIGCGAGGNLINIVKTIGGKQLGGTEINEDALKTVQENLTSGYFKIQKGVEIPMSDKSVDVVLSDMYLLYVGPGQINAQLEEMKRIGRSYVVLCELHSPSLLQRLRLRFNSGYYAYNYKKLLDKHGFYDIGTYKLKKKDWGEGEPQNTFAYLIWARVPQR